VTATREHIAGEVRAELARQGKSRAYLVELLNLEASAVSWKLHGKRSFRAEELAAIAAGLGVPVTQFTAVGRPAAPRRRGAA